MSDFHRGYCREHSLLYPGVSCPRCMESLFPYMTVPEMIFGRGLNLGGFNFGDSSNSVSLGRWEEQTDHDREFLQACGISQEL